MLRLEVEAARLERASRNSASRVDGIPCVRSGNGCWALPVGSSLTVGSCSGRGDPRFSSACSAGRRFVEGSLCAFIEASDSGCAFPDVDLQTMSETLPHYFPLS